MPRHRLGIIALTTDAPDSRRRGGVTVILFGFKDCQDTRKAQRFFSERRMAVHFVDLERRPPSPGELRRFQEKFGAAALIDRAGKRFQELGLQAGGDSPERLVRRALAEPRLLRTPFVRYGGRVTIGLRPEEWQRWAEARG